MFKFIDQPAQLDRSEEYYGHCGTGYGGSLLFQLINRATGRRITIAYVNSDGCLVRRKLDQEEMEILIADGFKIQQGESPSYGVRIKETKEKENL